MTGAVRVVSDERDDATISGWTLAGLGGFLVGCVVLGLLLGYLVDDVADSSPVGILVGLTVGVIVAVVGSWLRIASYLRR